MSVFVFICCYLVAGSYGRAYSRAQDLLLELYRAEMDDIEKGCGNNPADITFVLDASSSIWPPHFELQLEFVEDVVKMFKVGRGATHIGVMTFADNPTLHFDMDEYENEDDLLQRIGSIGQDFGGTATHKAISKMRTEMFSSAHIRPGLPHICILITDGKSADYDETSKEAQLARQQGITMFAIGVGKEYNMAELQNIASDPDDFYVSTAADYTALDKLRDKLAWKACQVTTLPPPTTPTTPTTTTTTTTTTPKPTRPPMIEGCNNSYPMDIIFAIPDQAGIDGAQYSVEFIESVVGQTVLSPIQVKVGVTPRFCDRKDGIYLNQHDTQKGFAGELQERIFKNARPEKHIQYMYTDGIALQNGGREEAAKFGILIVDNKFRYKKETLEQARQARAMGIDLIVIGVGEHADRSELRALAGDGHRPYFVDDYSELQKLKRSITDRICEGLLNYIK